MYGLLIEIGPLYLSGASISPLPGAVPRLFYNPNAWTREYNVLVTGFPPPVGYSYCTEPAGCPQWNDTSAARENYYFLQQFFAAYAELAANPVFLTGESYAGVYVPELVKLVLQDPGRVNLQGFALGDVCLGTESMGGCASVDWMYWNVLYLHGHEQISDAMFADIMTTCGAVVLQFGNYTTVPACYALLLRMQQATGGYNRINLYDTCYARVLSGAAPRVSAAATRALEQARARGLPLSTAAGRRAANRAVPSAAAGAGEEWDDHVYPCGGDSAMALWVDRADGGCPRAGRGGVDGISPARLCARPQ